MLALSRRWLLPLLTIALLSGLAFAAAPAARAESVTEVFDSLVKGREADSQARVRLITDNMTAWYARWYVVEHATKTIDCTYFIVQDDAFGRSFLGLLMKKAAEGVKLRFMVDARGTLGLSRKVAGQDLLQEIAALPNVEIKVFNPIHSQLLAMFKDLRNPIASNHDKIIVVDGEWVVIGGRNIAADYLADSSDFKDAWRDTDVLMQSATIGAQAKKAFEEEFLRLDNYEVTEDLVNLVSQHKKLEIARRLMAKRIMGMGLVDLKKLSDADDFQWFFDELSKFPSLTGYCAFQPWQGERVYPTVVIDKSSMHGDLDDITPALERFIAAAQKTIYIQNPYVVLTDRARAALKAASARGVRIVISTNSPMSTDSLSTQAFFLLDWKKICREMPTLEFYCFQADTQLHAKVFNFDDEVAIIGTYNMDPLSEQVNSEVVVAVKGRAFATRNRLRIENDMKSSIRYQIEVLPDGGEKVIKGPDDHVTPEVMEKLEKLQKLKFLRPLI